MAQLTIDWDDVRTGSLPAGTGRTARWLFGVVIDARTVATGQFVLASRCPSSTSIEAPVEPIDGLATAGVVAVLCDWQGCGGRGEALAYGAVAAAAINRLVAQRLPSPSARDLELWVEQDVTDTVHRGWTGLGPLADRHLATTHRLFTLDGPVEEPLDLRLASRAGEQHLLGTLRYVVGAPTGRRARAAA